jgi:DNA-directed RNA polymerase specialized sigma54-like protein
MDLSQSMRTEMRMKMAPRMIQSMEILQMPLMALQERIDQELNDNPLLMDMNEAEPGEAEVYQADGTSEKNDESVAATEEPLVSAESEITSETLPDAEPIGN